MLDKEIKFVSDLRQIGGFSLGISVSSILIFGVTILEGEADHRDS